MKRGIVLPRHILEVLTISQQVVRTLITMLCWVNNGTLTKTQLFVTVNFRHFRAKTLQYY